MSCEAEAEVGVMYGLLVEMGLISLPYVRGAIGVKTRRVCRGVGSIKTWYRSCFG